MTVQIVGELSAEQRSLVVECMSDAGLLIEEKTPADVEPGPIISLSKPASRALEDKGLFFYNWDLLFSVLGPNDAVGGVREKLLERIRVLRAIADIDQSNKSGEIHISLRVHDLAASARFYAWLYKAHPKEWTHRYVTIHRPDLNINLVLLVADGKTLNHDTLYHMGLGVEGKADVVQYYHSAVEHNVHVEKLPRTTWRGTPLHELWLKDPDGNLIEVYARLLPEELAEMPEDKEPIVLAGSL